MIEDHEIAAFPKALQDKIRADIARLVGLGRKLRHLALGRDGSVRTDYETIEYDADVAAFSKRHKADK